MAYQDLISCILSLLVVHKIVVHLTMSSFLNVMIHNFQSPTPHIRTHSPTPGEHKLEKVTKSEQMWPKKAMAWQVDRALV